VLSVAHPQVSYHQNRYQHNQNHHYHGYKTPLIALLVFLLCHIYWYCTVKKVKSQRAYVAILIFMCYNLAL